MLFKEASSSVEGAVWCVINRMKDMTLFQKSMFDPSKMPIVISHSGIVDHKYLVGIPNL